MNFATKGNHLKRLSLIQLFETEKDKDGCLNSMILIVLAFQLL